MHGMMKNSPGPLAPPFNKRPKRNITARSYSCTIYKFIKLSFSLPKCNSHLDAKENGYGEGGNKHHNGNQRQEGSTNIGFTRLFVWESFACSNWDGQFILHIYLYRRCRRLGSLWHRFVPLWMDGLDCEND